MSDLHALPLVEHDMPTTPVVRARVFKSGEGWYWSYETNYSDGAKMSALRHGPFRDQPEAYDSAHRMVAML